MAHPGAADLAKESCEQVKVISESLGALEANMRQVLDAFEHPTSHPPLGK